jgi:hypothetical protein
MRKLLLNMVAGAMVIVPTALLAATNYNVGPVEGRLKAVFSDSITLNIVPHNNERAPESNLYPSGDFSVRVNQDTRYENFNTLSQLKEGDWVRLTYRQDDPPHQKTQMSKTAMVIAKVDPSTQTQYTTTTTVDPVVQYPADAEVNTTVTTTTTNQ